MRERALLIGAELEVRMDSKLVIEQMSGNWKVKHPDMKLGLALGLLAIMFASLWLPWARIDRATFQYHYYTALPFAILALAYFVAELWHGPSRRT